MKTPIHRLGADRLLNLTAILLVGLTLTAGSALANTVVPGNDPFPGPLNGSPSLAKYEVDEALWEDGASPGDYRPAFSITNDGGWLSGTWSFDPSKVTGANPILFPTWMAVKAGNGYLVFAIALGTTSGSWSTEGLLNNGGRRPELSHLSFYDTGAPVIPIPAAAWLFGSALLGVIGIGYRRQPKSV